jgi:hypothetical protein
MDLKKKGCDSVDSGIESATAFCEHGNENSACIIFGKLYGLLNIY